MKRLLLLILLLSSGLRAQEPFYDPGYAKFLYELDTFNRKLLGCPLEPDYITKDDCHPARGIVDMKLWKDLQKRARVIFLLPKNVLPKEPADDRSHRP